MSMALSSSLRALARPILPFDSFSARLRLSGVAAPAVHASRRAGGGAAVGRGVAAGEEEAAVHAQPAVHRGVAVQHRVHADPRGPRRLVQPYPLYMKSSPGNLEKDVDRRFSYAVSREDIENTILGRTLIPSQGSKLGVYKHVFP